MRKIAVFVEGQAELILTRELLKQMFEFQDIRIECHALINDQLNYAPYDFGDKDAPFFYMIVNVGNDNSVLSKIKSRVEGLTQKGFCKVVGLRDVYGDVYKKANKNQRTINQELIKRFISANQAEIDATGHAREIRFIFAIMEVEAWFLGLREIFTGIDPCLTWEHIKTQLGYDLEKDDPETTHYHPAATIGDIFGLVGRKYDKHGRDVEPLVNPLTKEHYNELKQIDKCATFTKFVEELLLAE